MSDHPTSQARRTMVLSQLRPEGVNDPAILAAMLGVPREDFLPDGMRAMAYADRSVTLPGGAPMMAPADLGRLLMQLAPKAGERAAVIGGGGAYSAAVLDALGLSVTRADALAGLSGQYDIVIVEGAVDDLPSSLAAHLAAGGRIGGAVVDRGVGRLAIGRADGRSIVVRTIADTQLPYVPGGVRAPAFEF